MEKLNLSAPWITFAHEITALFEKDPEIKVIYDNDEAIVKLYVENAEKAEALQALLPESRSFGNVTVKIVVIPANALDERPTSLFLKAFEGNPVLSYVKDVECPLGKFNYVVFRNEVVQFFNDQLDDVNGNKSTLYQDIAKDVFEEKNTAVFFCTVTPENLAVPLGEWP